MPIGKFNSIIIEPEHTTHWILVTFTTNKSSVQFPKNESFEKVWDDFKIRI